MRRNVLFSILTIALFGFAIAFNLNQKHDSESERLLNNVEALANTDDHDDEEGGGGSGEDICQGEEASCNRSFCSNYHNYTDCRPNGDREACNYYTTCQY